VLRRAAGPGARPGAGRGGDRPGTRDRAPTLSWTRPEGWHVTLAFLGDVPLEALDDVGELIAGIAADADPIACELGEVGRFGRRALWLGVDDDPAGAIARLGAALQTALVASGWLDGSARCAPT
jgi:RNA 2',3'-cyclic 3'-phosphodiesterase